jgi:hypothetical protein
MRRLVLAPVATLLALAGVTDAGGMPEAADATDLPIVTG